jgi:hypothetical protein
MVPFWWLVVLSAITDVSRSFIENSAPDLYLLRIVYIICQNNGVLVGNRGGLFRNQ